MRKETLDYYNGKATTQKKKKKSWNQGITKS